MSRSADVVAAALTEMTGATSPRLHLELMIARILVPASDASSRGTLARVERLERRIGVEAPASREAARGPEPVQVQEPVQEQEPEQEQEQEQEQRDAALSTQSAPPAGAEPGAANAPSAAAQAQTPTEPGGEPEGERDGEPAPAAAPVTFPQLVDSWPEILEVVGATRRAAWAVVFTAKPMGLKDDVLALAFPSQNDVESFKKQQSANQSVSEILRQAIVQVLGIRVKFIARPDRAATGTADSADADVPSGAAAGPEQPAASESPEPSAPEPASVAAPPGPEDLPEDLPENPPEHPPTDSPGDRPVDSAGDRTEASRDGVREKPPEASTEPTNTASGQSSPGSRQRYGEAVVREILGANFIEEKPLVPPAAPEA